MSKFKLLIAALGVFAALWLVLLVGVLAYSFRSIGAILFIISLISVYLANKKFDFLK